MNNLITADIIADSVDSKNNRITSYILNVPQIIVKELLRHRMFSFSSSSMRAIPFSKVLKDTKENMFVPIAFQSHHSGMQGTSYLTGKDAKNAKTQWIQSGLKACEEAKNLYNLGVTKQLCSRIIEPYGYAKILVTATEYDNFFELRCPKYVGELYEGDTLVSKTTFKSWKDLCNAGYCSEKAELIQRLESSYSSAEIHIQALAESMWDAMNESKPKELEVGEWHIPDFGLHKGLLEKYISDYFLSSPKTEIKIAVAHCAKLSYNNHGNSIDFTKDIKLYNQLLASHHMSPFEHVARVMSDEEYDSFFKGRSYINQNEPNSKELNNFYIENGHGWCNNFRGFIPYRYLIENEKI